MRYAAPGETGSLIHLQSRYGNFINGEFVPPVNGNYFVNTTPINGSTIGEFPRSDKQDIDNAVAAAQAAADAWGKPAAGAFAAAAENCRPAGSQSGSHRGQ